MKIDGRHGYFEWLNAGRFETTVARGAMGAVDTRRIAGLWFGFDEERFLVRLDTRGGPARVRLADVDSLRIGFSRPEGFALEVARPSESRPSAELLHGGAPVGSAQIDVATAEIFELAVPWRLLGLATGDPLEFFVEALAIEQTIERVPRDGVIETTVPSPNFELMMWQA